MIRDETPDLAALAPPVAPRSSGAGAALSVPGAKASAGGVGAWVSLLRPRQWVKNCFVLAPLLFSGRATIVDAQLRSLAAFITFCLLASGVYILNDIVDRASDRAHPVKRHRPLASGAIGVTPALAACVVLLGASLVTSWTLSPAVGGVALAYLVINLLYTFWLKHVVIVDVFAIASFFVLRLTGGAAAIAVQPSVWLLLCGGLLALYLGFAKRRAELQLLGASSSDHRAVLSQYTTGFLDQLSVVLLSVTIVSYIMYTISSPTALEVGSDALSYSTVFVLYGVLRYLYLVHRSSEGGNPAETLVTDRGLLAAVLAWVAYCGYVIYHHA